MQRLYIDYLGDLARGLAEVDAQKMLVELNFAELRVVGSVGAAGFLLEA